MTGDELEPLPDALAPFVASELRREGPSDEAVGRLEARLAASAVSAAGLDAAQAPVSPAGHAGASAALPALAAGGGWLLPAVLAFGIGVAAGVVLHARLGPEPEVRVVYLPQPPAPQVVAQPVPEAPAIPARPPSAAPPSAAGSRNVRPGAVGTLDGERQILEAARTALARGNPKSALQHVAQHAARFPDGDLGQEREALWVQALVAAGDADEAARRASQFRARWPGSLLQPVVDSVSPP